jgi:hypothetical protein
MGCSLGTACEGLLSGLDYMNLDFRESVYYWCCGAGFEGAGRLAAQ